jgi:hypothetical protein
MVCCFEAVQLQHKLAIRDQLLVSGPAVIALAAEQTLIPSAACFHIGNGNERLKAHPGQRITLTRFVLKLWFACKHTFSANGSAFTTNSVRTVGNPETVRQIRNGKSASIP